MSRSDRHEDGSPKTRPTRKRGVCNVRIERLEEVPKRPYTGIVTQEGIDVEGWCREEQGEGREKE